MKTPPPSLLLILTCGLLFALTSAPHNATVESMHGSIFVDDEWKTNQSEYTACIKMAGNHTVDEIMVFDEFGEDVIRFAEINATEYGKLWYNGTSFETVTDFFDKCPEYSGKGQCVSSSRYYAFEAAKHNLSLQTCIIGGSGSAQHSEKHQVNTFKYGSVRYFTGNFDRADTTVLTSRQLIDVATSKFNAPIRSLNARGFWQPQKAPLLLADATDICAGD